MLRAILASFTYRPVQRWGPVSPHGVGTAVGFLAGAMLMARRAEPKGIPRPEVYNAVTWGAVGALIGARGFYVLGHLSQFTDIKDVFAVWQGGLTMFGGFVGGLVLGLGYLRRKGFSIPVAVDAAAPGFVVGVLIGRIGDIVIADHLGRATDFFLGYRIPDGQLAPGYGPPLYTPGAVVHHTAIYDFLGALVLLIFLFVLERRDPPAGSLFATFSVWYGLQRFLIDFTRNREVIESYFFGLSGSQWAGLAFAVGGVIALIRLRGRPPAIPVPAPEPVPVPVAEPLGETVTTEVSGGETPPLPVREETFAADPEPAAPGIDPVAQAEGVPQAAPDEAIPPPTPADVEQPASAGPVGPSAPVEPFAPVRRPDPSEESPPHEPSPAARPAPSPSEPDEPSRDEPSPSVPALDPEHPEAVTIDQPPPPPGEPAPPEGPEDPRD